MRCIYTVFYKNLNNYDGNDTLTNRRLYILELCLESYRRCNPNIPVIVDYVDDVIENTAIMYFDKMRRIKEMNYVYDVLWVDADTICLENLDDIITGDKMRGTFWGWWDAFNYLNGGVIYYPKKFLFNNWDFFVSDWIRMFSVFNENEKFIGPREQEPITNLCIRQISKDFNYKNYSFFDNYESLIKDGVLFDMDINYNPFVSDKISKSVLYDLRCNTILKKKILHLNASLNDYNFLPHVFEYVVNNLIGYTHDKDILINRCDELKISNKFINYKLDENNVFYIKNDTLSYFKIFYFLTSDLNLITSKNSLLKPGHFLTHDNILIKINTAQILIKNILSGEEIFL